MGDRVVVDTTSAALVWEPRRMVPSYAVPLSDLDAEVRPVEAQPEPPDLERLPPVLSPQHFEPHTSPGNLADVHAGGRTLPRAAYLPDDDDLAGTAVLDFGAFDRWQAEEEESVGHPRDPFKRIDVLTTSRQVRVELEGTVLAESQRAQMLLETPRRGALLHPRGRRTHGPAGAERDPDDMRLQGARGVLLHRRRAPSGRDIAWVYRQPLDDALRVRDLVCFWAERTDHVVDGRQSPRPVTPWSPRKVIEAALAEHGSLEFG